MLEKIIMMSFRIIVSQLILIVMIVNVTPNINIYEEKIVEQFICKIKNYFEVKYYGKSDDVKMRLFLWDWW